MAGGIEVCPFCRTNIKIYDEQNDFSDKLLSAVDHFEQETSLRAIKILGDRAEVKATRKLIDIIGHSKNPYTIEAALEALFKIGGGEFAPIYEGASKSPFYIVSEKATALLKLLDVTLPENGQKRKGLKS